MARFLKSGIPIYNSEIPDTAGRQTRKRTQAIANRFLLHANAIKRLWILSLLHFSFKNISRLFSFSRSSKIDQFRDHRQKLFVTLNGFCLLSKKTPPSLNLKDNFKLKNHLKEPAG